MAKPRKKINIYGGHAHITELESKDVSGLPKGIIKRQSHKYHSNEPYFRYSLGQSLAYLFFPKSFPKLIATNKDGQIVYSKKIELDNKSQKAIEDYYEYKQVDKHEQRVEESESVKKMLKKFEQAGLIVNDQVVNIGFKKKNGKPVFFEIRSVNFAEAIEFAEKIKNPRRREAALDIIMALEKRVPNESQIRTH